MKKLLIILAIFGIGITSAHAQKHFTFGLSGGIPLADVDESHSLHASADIAYRVDLIKLLDIGGVVGYSHYFKKDDTIDLGFYDNDDLQFITAAGTARLRILAILFAGTDIGYAIGLSNNTDGGFYIRPQIGLNLGVANVLVTYSNISADGATIAAINGGVEIKF